MRFVHILVLPLFAASQCIQEKSIRKLAGKKFTISPQAKDRISSISVRFRKEDDCVVKARFGMTMGKIALEKGLQYKSPWLKVEQRNDTHGNYWSIVAESRDKRALQSFVDRVAGDAYLDRHFSAFIGHDQKGKLQVEVIVGRTDRINVFSIIPLQRSCFESMSAPSPAVDQWWSAKKHLLAESGIPDNHKQHLANYYATTSLGGRSFEDVAQEWLETVSRVHFDRGDTAPDNSRVVGRGSGSVSSKSDDAEGGGVGRMGYSVPRRMDWEWLEELPISSSAFKRTSVQSRRTSIAKDPGQIFDELWEKSRDVRPLADGSIRADASGSVRLLSRLCEAMDINLRTTRFGKNWLKHSVVFCHFAVGMGGISRESLKKRWVIWYDSVRSLNMDTDVPPPVAATR
ncbi:hypothetical protein FOZ61_006533 [Perkinsus olseni]|uniref:Uncharacterized protein n=1 Tax=Perkinsus olseni TaxID=32597 RepID=A0A7J6LD43_PEROL|nr:hypothetical protein FOZ61_006533 [Perkinsus olseni]